MTLMHVLEHLFGIEAHPDASVRDAAISDSQRQLDKVRDDYAIVQQRVALADRELRARGPLEDDEDEGK